ncbi:hypothetical protein [Aliiroseovarius sp. YM-037]|uniref:hypothetical protein n=1 Tax=Aliiroseovarius sp. YM-037 TaxID=3341728 RepID=UPI003A8064F1
MKTFAAISLSAVLLAVPVSAETASDGKEDMQEGFSLLEEGAKILLRGLMEEMEPAMEDLQGFAENMGPAMRELQGMIGDMTDYHMPERLPNGDIIIRRKTPLENDAPGEGEIEL